MASTTSTTPVFNLPPLPTPPPELLTAEQAAQRLFVKPAQVGKYLKSGELKGAKVGRRLLIPLVEVNRFIENRMGYRGRR
jgi:excisionase family DNA binding protein